VAEKFDIVIIGSGAGGAPIAAELAAWKDRELRILVLEKGPKLRTQEDNPTDGFSDFKRDELLNAGPEKRINLGGDGNVGRSFYSSHIEPDLNDEPHLWSDHGEQNPRVTVEGYTAQVVGGGTQLYGAVSLRFTERDFMLASAERPAGLPDDPYADTEVDIKDWPITYADLLPYYEKAETLVGINGSINDVRETDTPAQEKPFPNNCYQKPLNPNPISQFALDGMKKIGAQVYRTPLAVITEAHAPSGRPTPGWVKTGYVNRYGDPLGYKSNTWVSLLRPAMRAYPGRIDLRCNCTVTHLEASGKRISKVHYRDASGFPKSVEGQVVVVACSAIESVRLLMLSAEEDLPGLGKLLRYDEDGSPLGRYFLTHCFGGAEVSIPKDGDRYDKTQSLDSDYATDWTSRVDFLRDNKMWAGAAIYNNTSDQSLPITLARTDGSNDLDTWWQGFDGDLRKTGEGILDWMDADFGTRLSVSFMANQVPWRKNRIRLSDVRDKWNRKSAWVVKEWHPHDGHVMRTLARVCEDILLAGIPGTMRDSQEGNTWDRGVIGEGSVYGQGVRIANHILGGARFGTDRATSVLDPNCRVWDIDNLYVTDGCFMPTSGGGNPTLTIQANSFRVADLLKQVL
jgi:choline dehydrogenase-like flavoprotein